MKERTTKGRLKSAALLCAAAFGLSAWAATTPTAEWCGDFPVSAASSTAVTSTQNGWTISKNNNANNVSTADGITVNGYPATLIPSSGKSALTVVVAYSGSGVTSSTTGTLINFGVDTTGSGARFNLNLSSGAFKLGYKTTYTWSDSNNITVNASQTDSDTHYAIFSYSYSAGTSFYFDGTKIVNTTALRDSGASISDITLGAIRGPANYLSGVTYSYVAVYDSVLSDDDALTAYKRAYGYLNNKTTVASGETVKVSTLNSSAPSVADVASGATVEIDATQGDYVFFVGSNFIMDDQTITTLDGVNVQVDADCTATVSIPALRDFSSITAEDGASVTAVATLTTEEYGKGSAEFTNASGISSITVLAPDGTTTVTTLTPEEGTATYSADPVVSGSACWCDYELNGDLSNVGGSDSTALTYDSGFSASDSFYDSKTLYTYTHPWRDLTYSSGTWTAVVRCTVPNLAGAAIITFGTQSAGLIGLIAGDDPETTMKLIQTTGNSTYSELASMTVADATSAQHVYIFTVVDNQRVIVYCDGTQVLDKSFDSAFSIGSGIQVASVHGGVGSTGIQTFRHDDETVAALDDSVKLAAQIDCIRLYDYQISDAQISALTTEFPAVKLFKATVSKDADWGNLDWSTTWDGGNEYSKVILTVTADATLTLPETITLEDLDFEISSGVTLTLAGSCTATISNPVVVNTGTLDTAGVLTGIPSFSGTGSVVYYWTGAGSDTNWTTPANWGLTSGYPSGTLATAKFDTAAEVTLTADQAVSALVLNANLTLTGSDTYGLTGLTSITGDGSLVLNGSGIANYYTSSSATDLDFSNAVVVNADTTNWMTGGGYFTKSGGSYSAHAGLVKVRGAITGSGYLKLQQAGAWASGVQLYGDNTKFAGTAEVVANSISAGSTTLQRNTTVFCAENTWSANAKWIFGNVSYTSPLGSTVKDSTIELGTFETTSGFSLPGSSTPTFKVGALSEANDTFTWGGSVSRGSNGRSLNITKVGEGTLDFTGSIVSGNGNGIATLSAGKFLMDGTGQQVQGIVFNGGTLGIGSNVTYDNIYLVSATPEVIAKVSIEDEDMDYETSSGRLIDDSYVAGLVKSGDGTLTLTASGKTFSGTVTVEAGTLVLPSSTTLNGAVTLSGGTLQTPIGTVFGSTVSVTDGTIAIPGDAAWEDASEQTLVTFTDTTLFAEKTSDELKEIFSITGLGERQTYTFDASTGALVATISGGTLVWNGADGANWTDEGAWLLDGEAATFLSGDKVQFTDAAFGDEGTALTVNIPSDVDPAAVTFSNGEGKTYTLTGDGKVTSDVTIAKSGDGTLKLSADVFNGLVLQNDGEGTVEIAADVTLGHIANATPILGMKDSYDYKATILIDADATLTIPGSDTYGTLNNQTFVINGTIVFDGAGSSNREFLSHYSGAGDIILQNGVTYRAGYYQNGDITTEDHYYGENFTGNLWVKQDSTLTLFFRNKGFSKKYFGGTYHLAGGKINFPSGNGSDVYLYDLVVEDGTESTIDCASTTKVTYLDASGTLTGSGTLNINLDTHGIRIDSDMTEFTGIMNFIGIKVQSDMSGLRKSLGSSSATFNVIAKDGYAPTELTKWLYFEMASANKTLNLGALNVDNQYEAVYLKQPLTMAIGANDGDCDLEGAFAMQNAGTYNIVKSGSGTLTLGSGFQIANATTLGLSGDTDYSGNAQTVNITVNEGKFVSEVASFDGVNFTFADGVYTEFTVAEGSEESTDDVKLLRTTGTITLTGTQAAVANGSTSGYAWKLATTTETVDDVTYYVLKATSYENTEATWIGDDGDSWTDATKWDTRVVPTSATAVTIPSTFEGTIYTGLYGATVYVKSLTVDGDLTLSGDSTQSDWSGINVYGDIGGEGTLTLLRSGVYNRSGETMTISVPLVIADADGSDSFLDLTGFNVTGTVEVNDLFVVYVASEFKGLVTLNDGAVVQASQSWYNSGADVALTFSGGIEVAEDATVSFTRNAHTVTGTVTLGADSTFTLASGTIATDASFVLDNGASLVVTEGATVTAANVTAKYETTTIGYSGDGTVTYTATAVNTASEWIGGSTGEWNTRTNWSTGEVPTWTTAVTFPTIDEDADYTSYTISLSANNWASWDAQDKCGTITLNAPVKLYDVDSTGTCLLAVYGNIGGSDAGSLTLSGVGLQNGTWDDNAATLAISVPLYTDGDNAKNCWFVSADNGFTITSAELWKELDIYCPATFTSLTLQDGVTAKIGNSKTLKVESLVIADGATAYVAKESDAATVDVSDYASATADDYDVTATTSDDGLTTTYVSAEKSEEETTIDPTTGSATFDTEEEANAATVAVPDGIEVEATTYNSYFTKTVTANEDGTYTVTVTLNASVVLPTEDSTEETAMLTDLAAVATDDAETATVPTKAGLYYWIAGATEVGASSYTAGTAVLGTGGDVELSKPELSDEDGAAFYKVSVDVSDPATASQNVQGEYTDENNEENGGGGIL